MLGDHRDVVALAPHLQLLDGGGAEGVAGGEHDLPALQLQLLRQLADGGGLADAVHADHQDHVGIALFDLQRLFHRPQQAGEFFLQRLVQRAAVGQLLARHALGQVLDDHAGRLDADVGGQQARLDLVEQLVVDRLAAEEQAGHALADAGAGLRQALLEAGEEAELGRFGAGRCCRDGFHRGRSGGLLDRRTGDGGRRGRFDRRRGRFSGRGLGNHGLCRLRLAGRGGLRRFLAARHEAGEEAGLGRRFRRGLHDRFGDGRGFDLDFGNRAAGRLAGCGRRYLDRLDRERRRLWSRSGFGSGLRSHRLDDRRRSRLLHHRCGIGRRRGLLGSGLWRGGRGLGGRLLLQPAEQTFLFPALRGFLVVVGTKHEWIVSLEDATDRATGSSAGRRRRGRFPT
ncbi:hypothetical protein D9M71_296700 [compost metagenome]